ncbi:MAG: hypothetical protein SGJ20_03220 [Planctomycetota bacterium]|nr:hypothetical protein [Planctomycetota bacterium]
MSNRFSRVALGLFVVAAIALLAQQAWAVYFALGPSKDEWGLKYDVAVEDAGNDMYDVTFTLADEGRLKPIHSISLAVFDKQSSSQSGKTYEVKGKFALKPTADGKRAGTMQVRKDQAEQAILRVLTQRVDGKFQSAGAAYYEIPLAKILKGTTSPGIASPPVPAVR